MRETKKVIETIFRNLAKGMNIAIFLLFGTQETDHLQVIQWSPALHG